jgi:hypothetical protein
MLSRRRPGTALALAGMVENGFHRTAALQATITYNCDLHRAPTGRSARRRPLSLRPGFEDPSPGVTQGVSADLQGAHFVRRPCRLKGPQNPAPAHD